MIIPSRTLKAAVALLIIVSALGADQVTKHVARARLDGQPAQRVLGGTVVLRYVENEGAFLSLGAGLPAPVRMAVFVAFPLIVLALMVAFLLRRRGVGWGTLVGLSLVVGGGAGNLADRILRAGHVGDFLMLGVGPLHTGILNLADLAVFFGCVVLLFAPSGSKKKPRTEASGSGA